MQLEFCCVKLLVEVGEHEKKTNQPTYLSLCHLYLTLKPTHSRKGVILKLHLLDVHEV